jgi:hypothetical protein
VYPNPSNGEFTIVIPDNETASTLVVMNTLGQIVLSEILQTPTTKIKSDLAQGVYYYQTRTTTKTLSSGKLIVE